MVITVFGFQNMIFSPILLSDHNYTTGASWENVNNVSRVTFSDIVCRKKIDFSRMTSKTDLVMPPVVE